MGYRKRSRLPILLIILGVLVVSVIAAFNSPLLKPPPKPAPGETFSPAAAQGEKADLSATAPLEPQGSPLANLELQLLGMCPDNNGLWAIYVQDLKTGEYLSINNGKMVAASLIKLFIMGAVYQAINAGEMENNEMISDMIKRMITISHNESSNKLVEILGQGSHEKGMVLVNNYARSIGCLDTEQQRDMKDYRAIPVPEENYTSVEDCASLLEKIYKYQCISPELDQEMIDLLLAQERNTKIPLLLPAATKIAHKTGELSSVENDVGIVFGTKSDYIICVISNELKNSGEARKNISQISKAVYDYFIAQEDGGDQAGS